jgi:hypothetical protein
MIRRILNAGAVAPIEVQVHGSDHESLTDPAGNTTSVTSWTGDKPAEVQRTNTTNGTTVTESYLYTYTGSLITNAMLRRQVNGGSWTTVRQTANTYDANNNLKLAVVEEGSGNALDTTYNRWYTSGQANGYAGALKYKFGPQSYARLVAALGTNVDSLTDAQVALGKLFPGLLDGGDCHRERFRDVNVMPARSAR